MPEQQSKSAMTENTQLPTFFIPHGGGPCFFMDWTMGPPDTWHKTRDWLLGFLAELPAKPRAVLIISAHWENEVTTVTAGAKPPLIYDYYGFPPHTYELTWPANGDPALAARVAGLLESAGIDCQENDERGFDHGVFIPMKLINPAADIPTVALSLRSDLDAGYHLEVGAALATLRDEGVLIIGSGFSYHNFEGFNSQRGLDDSQAFTGWLTETLALPADQRSQKLGQWQNAPEARASHPREEHLLPLMVAAGASDRPGAEIFRDQVMGVLAAGYRF